MEDDGNRNLVCEVAREVLTSVAPNELPIFSVTSNMYFANPKAALKQAKPGDSPLGIGMGAAALITPVVLHLVSELFDFLAPIVADALKKGLGDSAADLLKRVLKPRPAAEAKGPPLLTLEQIQEVQRKVQTAVLKLQVPPEQREMLVNAVIAQLVAPRD